MMLSSERFMHHHTCYGVLVKQAISFKFGFALGQCFKDHSLEVLPINNFTIYNLQEILFYSFSNNSGLTDDRNSHTTQVLLFGKIGS
jgi:hypothetical protein